MIIFNGKILLKLNLINNVHDKYFEKVKELLKCVFDFGCAENTV